MLNFCPLPTQNTPLAVIICVSMLCLSFNWSLSKGPVVIPGKFQGNESFLSLCNKCNVCHYLLLALSSYLTTYFMLQIPFLASPSTLILWLVVLCLLVTTLYTVMMTYYPRPPVFTQFIWRFCLFPHLVIFSASCVISVVFLTLIHTVIIHTVIIRTVSHWIFNFFKTPVTFYVSNTEAFPLFSQNT
jgi:hypothetical protein